jgi:hypothetical protein
MRARLILLSAVLPLAACQTQPMQTASDTTRQNLGGAVSAPLQDFNVVRAQIPYVLREAETNPYAKPNPPTCATLAAELARLDEALGPDIDVKQDPMSRSDKNAQYAAKGAVAAVKGVTESWIPMKDWVRIMSGAQGHDDAVNAAISAGRERRAYLKGLAQAGSCPQLGPHSMEAFIAPPVTPSSVTN